jgi:hypothetical protein
LSASALLRALDSEFNDVSHVVHLHVSYAFVRRKPKLPTLGFTFSL